MGDGVRSFGAGSSLDALYRLNSWNLLLGVSFTACTAVHSAEERVQVPYRAYRDFRHSTVVLADGTRVPCQAVEYLRQDDSGNDFGKMETVLADKGLLRAARLGQSRCMNARVRDVIDAAVALLTAAPYALSRPRPANPNPP
jgi:aminoglycoside 3-N-acetyltransferase